MEFEVLGPVQLRQNGGRAAMAGGLQRVLLGVLLARANSTVAVDALTDAMWGEGPGDRAGAKLHVHVHRLRRALAEPDRLTSEPGGYRLAVLPGELDAQRFESLLDEGAELREHNPRRAVDLLRTALGLWRGEPFQGTDAPLLAGEAHRLAERRLVGIEGLYTAELACGRNSAAVTELTEHVRRHPLHERLRGLLMVALYRGGQQGRALAVYRCARQLLVDELGQEPGPELRHVEQRILAGQPVNIGTLRQHEALPAQLPHDIGDFTGRRAELSILDDMLSGDALAPIATISGTGGVGKTALAVRWAHRARARFPDGQLYVDLHGYGPETTPPVSPEDALARFLRELGVDSAAIPGELAERAGHFRTVVAGRRVLIVLDNAGTVEQVRPLLPGGPLSLVLVTSRDALPALVAREGARRIPLDRLRQDDALGLLRLQVGARVDDESDAAAQLVDRCARLPLALRIAAELISARAGRGIDELAAELADERHSLHALDAGGDPTTAVRSVFSWSYQRLSPDTARAFRLLGLHPGHDIDDHALAALGDRDLGETKRLTAALLRAHLLEEPSPGRYQPHDLLRAYAADRCRSTETDAEQQAALDRLFDHYLRTASTATSIVHGRTTPRNAPEPSDAERFTDSKHAADWLDAEMTNLATVTQHAAGSGRPDITTKLAATLHRYLSVSGRHDHALTVHAAALDAARHAEDLTEEGNASRYLGAVHRRLGHFTAALRHMHHALACYEQTGHGQSRQLQLNHLAVTYTWLGRFPEAHHHLEQSFALSEELDEQGRIGRIGALSYLGQLHVCRGEPEKALRCTTEALAHLDGSDHRVRADTEVIAGIACDRLGHYERARRHLEYVRSVSQETGTHVLQAYASPLAHVYWQLGRRDEAFDYVQHCLAIARRTSERIIEAGVHVTFGQLHRLADTCQDALAEYRATLDLVDVGGPPFEGARARAGMGDTYLVLGDRTQARANWRRALDIYRDLGSADEASVLAKLGSAR